MPNSAPPCICKCPQWQEALIAFTKAAGYNFLSQRIQAITCPTLVIWGQQDKILGTKDAQRFEQTIPHCELVWVPDCGHVPHLEKPHITAEAISRGVHPESRKSAHENQTLKSIKASPSSS